MCQTIFDILSAVGTCIGAIGACIFGYYQYQINKRMLENGCIAEIVCYLETHREYDDSLPEFKLQFQVTGNSPVDMLFALLGNEYQEINSSFLGEDIVHYIKLLRIGDNPNIDIVYRDNIGRYYRKRFLLDVHMHNARLPLHSFFKSPLSRKEVEKIKRLHLPKIPNTPPSSSNK